MSVLILLKTNITNAPEELQCRLAFTHRLKLIRVKMDRL